MKNPENPKPNEGSKKIPKYKFNRSAEESLNTGGLREHIEFTLDGMDGMTGLDYKKVNEEQAKEVRSISDHHIEWIKKNLGLDIADRGIDANKIRLCKIKDIDKQIGKFSGLEAGVAIDAYVLHPSKEIVTRDDLSPRRMYCTLSHEFIHVLAGLGVHVDMEKKCYTTKSAGLSAANISIFSGISEVITEMANIEMLDHYRGQSDGKDFLTDIPRGPHASIMAINAFLEKMAERTGKTAKELRHDLYRGYFESRLSVLRVFKDGFDAAAEEKYDPKSGIVLEEYRKRYTADAMKGFSKINNGVWPLEEILTFCQMAGVDFHEVLDKVYDLGEGEEVELFDGITYRLSSELVAKDSNKI